MESTGRPTEPLSLRSATATYLAMLRDVDQWAEQAVDVNRVINPDYAARLDRLRDELRATQSDHEMGTVAMIGRVLAELLGEAEPTPAPTPAELPPPELLRLHAAAAEFLEAARAAAPLAYRMVQSHPGGEGVLTPEERLEVNLVELVDHGTTDGSPQGIIAALEALPGWPVSGPTGDQVAEHRP